MAITNICGDKFSIVCWHVHELRWSWSVSRTALANCICRSYQKSLVVIFLVSEVINVGSMWCWNRITWKIGGLEKKKKTFASLFELILWFTWPVKSVSCDQLVSITKWWYYHGAKTENPLFCVPELSKLTLRLFFERINLFDFFVLLH